MKLLLLELEDEEVECLIGAVAAIKTNMMLRSALNPPDDIGSLTIDILQRLEYKIVHSMAGIKNEKETEQ